MDKTYWIWYADDFEIYHHQLMQNRRIENGFYYGNSWNNSSPHRDVMLRKISVIDKDETVILHSNTDKACIALNGKRYPAETEVKVEKGENRVEIHAYKPDGFPCVYVDGETFKSDKTWECRKAFDTFIPVGTNEMFTSLDSNPEVFPFEYIETPCIKREQINGGVLFDFGKELFARLIFTNVKENSAFTAYLGESREEALAKEKSDLFVFLKADGSQCVSDAWAFRYVFIQDDIGDFELTSEYEYLPIEKVGSFHCSDDLLNDIWNKCAYTFELNSREGFLDGIKRDRWAWSGDAYQSDLTAPYIYADDDIIRRTAVMLRGSEPFNNHINTIPDYTFYWICSIREYFDRTGDIEFLKRMYPKMCATMDFVESRLDENGMYVRRPADWVFIDWADFDKQSGPICAEQMLLYYAYSSMDKCSKLMGDTNEHYSVGAENVKAGIEKYWNEGKGAYVDDYKTRNENVTRHANIFALRFGIADEERKDKILKNVLFNDEIPPITTPYFRFFELEALGEYGCKKEMLNIILSYWGGMLKEGATSIWEAYDPTKNGVEHYEMYGRPFGKSLCHAWGASPIYLIGKYILGVTFGDEGKSFTVKPDTELLESFAGTVPVNGGTVTVKKQNGKIKVLTTAPGGTLVISSQIIPLVPDNEIEV